MTSASLPSPADTAALLQPAFQDPVLDAQRSFRAALKALAEPGLVRNLDRAPALAALQPASYALCLSFLDSDTPLWLRRVSTARRCAPTWPSIAAARSSPSVSRRCSPCSTKASWTT